MNYKLPPLPTFEEWEKIIYPAEPGTQISSLDRFLQAYAIAAIEAQGVPEHCDPSCTSYELAAMVMSDCGHSTNNQRLLDRIAERIGKHVEALLASAPPAPQASVVQQEPVAWIRPSGKAMLEAGGYCTVYASDGMSNHSTPLYTHPAPQAKPQPLTSDQKWDMWTAATIEQPSARGCYFRGVEDAEHAHGITKE